MRITQSRSDIYIPDGSTLEEVVPSINDLGIGAHQDDLEIIGFPGIVSCYDNSDRWFGGVVCTDGVPERSGDPQSIKRRRNEEQRQAADLGQYAFVIQLDYKSSDIKAKQNDNLSLDIERIIMESKPQRIFTHNPFDKHTSHLAVVKALVQALRRLGPDFFPKEIYGIEVWRGLDWIEDRDKIRFDVSAHKQLGLALMQVFQSQIEGGKAYDEAVVGRRSANACFADPYYGDHSDQVILGVDLLPLIRSDKLSAKAYLEGFTDRFNMSIGRNIDEIIGGG